MVVVDTSPRQLEPTRPVNRLLEVGFMFLSGKRLHVGCAQRTFVGWELCESRGWQRRARAIKLTSGVALPLFGRESIGEVAKWAPCVNPVHNPANPQDLKKRSRKFRMLLLKRLRMPFPQTWTFHTAQTDDV